MVMRILSGLIQGKKLEWATQRFPRYSLRFTPYGFIVDINLPVLYSVQ
jgi:hypothetical protein